MIRFENEETIWESKNKHLLLTTHRLREMNKSIFGSTIKSIMLEELTSCELKTSFQTKFIKKAIFYFLAINGLVYIFNNFFCNAEIVKALAGDLHLGPTIAQVIFYTSLIISGSYIVTFFMSVRKTFSFYATGMTINFQLRWLDFEERENFISKVEEAKFKRSQRS